MIQRKTRNGEKYDYLRDSDVLDNELSISKINALQSMLDLVKPLEVTFQQTTPANRLIAIGGTLAAVGNYIIGISPKAYAHDEVGYVVTYGLTPILGVVTLDEDDAFVAIEKGTEIAIDTLGMVKIKGLGDAAIGMVVEDQTEDGLLKAILYR